MERKQLLEVLGLVRPALASTSLIQVLTHFCFSGDEVTAYNDQIGLGAPLASGFEGAAPGMTLLGILGTLRAPNVELAASGDALEVRTKSAHLKLPLLPPDSFLFRLPEFPKKGAPLPAGDLAPAIKSCLRSVSPDTSVPDQLGVTLIPGKKGIDLYSINGASMSREFVPGLSLPQRVVLSAPFCEQLVQLAGPDDSKAALVIAEDHALLRTAAGVRLFGKFVDVPRPLEFELLFAEVVPADLDRVSAEMPPKTLEALRAAIERALIIADPSGERVYTRLVVKNEILNLHTKSGRGSLVDRVRLAGHPDVDVQVDAQWIKVGCAEFNRMLITEGAVIFGSGRALYLVAPN